MAVRQIVVLGGGFAGLWAAVGAARKLDELGFGPNQVDVTLVNRDPYHSVRVRNYETDLSQVRVPLDEVLAPVGVRRIEAEVTGLDLAQRSVLLSSNKNPLKPLPYDRLVMALGSRLFQPEIPGLAEYAFNIDTYDAAVRLNDHLANLAARSDSPAAQTIVVVGAGLTGIEAATEMRQKLASIQERAGTKRTFRVILADHRSAVGSDMGDSARPVIEQALEAQGIDTRLGVRVRSVNASGIALESGESIPTATVVWCAGMRASPVTRLLPVEHDRLGRVPVDQFLRVRGVVNVFAAGDVAAAMMDDQHVSVMSCQHARPMGRFAGHNAVCDLLGLPMLPLEIDWYVTVLDLGSSGAVYTEGWQRQVVAQGKVAKRTKQVINCQRIYPPLTGDRAEILAAAAPVVQAPPEYRERD